MARNNTLSVFVQRHTYLRSFTETLQSQLWVSEQTQLARNQGKKKEKPFSLETCLLNCWLKSLKECEMQVHGETAFLQICIMLC